MVSSSPATSSARPTATWFPPQGRRKRDLLALLLAVLALTVAGVMGFVPFSTPMGGFWFDAQQFARTGHIATVFTPCGYPAFLGLALLSGGIPGVIGMQLLLYLAILLAAYSILRLLDLPSISAAAGAALLGFHPEIVINIKKIWDTNITTVLLLVLCAVLLLVMRKGLTPGRALLTGILWGLSMNIRPNFPALLLPIAFAFWAAPAHAERRRARWWQAALAPSAAIVTLVILNTAVHGSFYLPQNGPYNLYAGDNAFTERALLVNLNAEPSIYPSLLANGFPAQVDVYDPALRPYYVSHALLFVRQYPSAACKLVLLKLATLLRPDTKIYPMASPGGIVKCILALAIPLWLTVLIVRKGLPWAARDWLFVTFAVAYILPFLLTNADPRFRVPLDVLLLTHTYYRVACLTPRRVPAIA